MSRAPAKTRRKVNADPKYGSVKIARLINRVMEDGKKEQARKQVYAALDIIHTKTGQDALEVFDEVLKTVSPLMEVRSRRVGGAAYQVPMPVRGTRSFSLAVRWLIESARNRSNSDFHSFGEKLAQEMLDALKGEGGAMSKRANVHKMADANKAFAHFRW